MVRIVNVDGRGCPGVLVAVQSAQGPVPELAYVTDDEGWIRIGLPPGKTRLEAIPPGGRRQTFSIDASPEPGHAHQLRLAGGKR